MNPLVKKMPNILVVDDDPVFRALIYRVAKRRAIPVTVCASMRELVGMAVPQLFDAAVVDYFLDDIKQNLVGTDIAAVLESTPVVLVSSTDQAIESGDVWPTSVRKFLNKKVGADAILDSVILLTEGART
jgi:CheY-like chemotaxis protein